MRKLCFILALMAAGSVLSACSHARKQATPEPSSVKTEEPAAPAPAPEEPKGPTPEEIAAWKSAAVSTGDAREAVEKALGEPSQLSRTKDGLLYVLYEKGDNWRSVIYDDHGKVLEVYP